MIGALGLVDGQWVYVVKVLGDDVLKDTRFFLLNIPPLACLLVAWFVFQRAMPPWLVVSIACVGIAWGLVIMVLADRAMPTSHWKTLKRRRQAWLFWLSAVAWGLWFVHRLVGGDLVASQVVGVAMCLILMVSVGWVLWAQGSRLT